MKPILLSTVLVATLLPVSAAHRAILPTPQKLTYGAGAFRLGGARIGFAHAPAAEDRFAARQLAGCLQEATGTPVAVASSGAAAIVLERTGAVAALPLREEKPGPESRESYRISITAKGVRVKAPSSAGLYYAVQTLRQMVEGSRGGAVLPAAEIHDWPLLAYRGYMMDLSHGSLLKEEEIKRQIDFLARWKANQYFFYSEFTIELKGHPLINPGARYSQEQVARIIEYARERHVDVVPCLEYFGHMHDLFRIEKYADLAFLPHGDDINPRNPKVKALLEDWIGQMAKLFPSPWFHAGLDEPFELEAIGSKAAGGVEPGKLYQELLLGVAEIVRKNNKRFLFWADVDAGARIFEKYPNLVTQLPPDAVPVPWYYWHRPNYESFFKPFGAARIPVVAAPGINIYTDLFPDYTVMMHNIDGFVGDGLKYGAFGVLNTGWTDDAQTIYRMAWPGLAYGALVGWQSVPVDRARFFTQYAAQFHGQANAEAIGRAIQALAESRDAYRRSTRGATIWAFWANPFEPETLKLAEAHREDLRQTRLKAEEALELLLPILEKEKDTAFLTPFRLAAEMLDYAGQRQIYALEFQDFFRIIQGKSGKDMERGLYLGLEMSEQDHSRTADLMDAISGMKESYRQAWLNEATEYRLGSALGRWDAEYEFWRRMQQNIRQFRASGAVADENTLQSLVPKM
jgi:hypothetical protein